MSSNPKQGIRVRRGVLELRIDHDKRKYYQRTDLKDTKSGWVEAFKRRAAAKERLKLGMLPFEEEQPDSVVKMGSFGEVAQAYLDEADLKASTRGSYKVILNQYWIPAFSRLDIKAITLTDIKHLARKTKWSSIKTKKNAATALRQVFEWAVDEEYIDSNPATRFRTKRNKDVAKPKADPYTVKERDALLNWLKEHASKTTYAYFLLAFGSGMRTGELLALRWDDYDGLSFMVERSRTRGEIVTTKTDETRKVLLTDKVCGVIGGLPSRFKRGYVFLAQRDKPYQSGYHLNQVFTKAHDQTNTPRSTSPNYPWRHTYASIGLISGLEPAFLAKQLGHSLSVFETTYAKWIDRDEDREKLNEKML